MIDDKTLTKQYGEKENEMRKLLSKYGKTCTTPLLAGALAAGVMLGGGVGDAGAALLTHESFSITGSGGSGGSGSIWSDMIYSSYGADGWGWAGGAGGVQGNTAITNTGGTSSPTNETFRFRTGAVVDSLNKTYGAGNWTISNATLSFNSSYSVQNNSRFGVGTGTFDIYWVGNDNWAQSKGTTSDRQLNPIYATSATGLQTWAGTMGLLGSEAFSVPTGGSGYVALNYNLASNSNFVNDILNASASGNQDVSLYLMATNPNLGMIIFTGWSKPGAPHPQLRRCLQTCGHPNPGRRLAVGFGTHGSGGHQKKKEPCLIRRNIDKEREATHARQPPAGRAHVS